MEKLDDFIKRYPLRHFEKDQILLVQDERPREVYFIHSGYIKSYDINIDGIEQLIWLGSKGDILPYAWLFSVIDSTQLFYSAFTAMEVYVVNKQDLMEFLGEHPDVLLYVSHQMARELSELTQKLTATEKPKASEKIVHMLRLLAGRYGEPNSAHTKTEITIPLTQQDIANLLGLTRETVATELKKFKDKGYVYYDKWHFVVHTDKVEELL